ncbi:hypothetical protein [Streptomyces harbinensis]|uniref:Uncharacterized protein n=3 Tax=Streptomyces TaxID=1883 RepID=A0A1I6V6B4_9ACTN|nr:hypothetical protein [Streptomyces harbinensis]SFT09251.1 hypothetical protein SAMN05444716_107117 [Streptomyces harbinensis]
MIGEIAGLAVGAVIMAAGIIVLANVREVADRLDARMKARIGEDVMPSLQPLGDARIQGGASILIGGLFVLTSVVNLVNR